MSDSFVTPWTAARQASLSCTISQSLLRFMSFESVTPSNHLILCHPSSSCPQSFPASWSLPVSPIHISPLTWISFPSRSPQSIEQSSCAYSRFSLVIYFMHSNNSVYVSELSSAFILSSIHLLLFCPATCFPPDFQPPPGEASASPFFPTPTCHMDWLILESASK